MLHRPVRPARLDVRLGRHPPALDHRLRRAADLALHEGPAEAHRAGAAAARAWQHHGIRQPVAAKAPPANAGPQPESAVRPSSR